METETVKTVKECTQCGWKGSDDERATKQDGVWTTYICPNCSCESFYNVKEQAIKLAISKNVHPNTDGSPWGWIVIEGTRLRVATWSGYEEKKRCEEVVIACNSHYELLNLLELALERIKSDKDKFDKDLILQITQEIKKATS